MQESLKVSIESFVSKMLKEDREISSICIDYKVETAEVLSLLRSHFLELGIYEVISPNHQSCIRQHIVKFLKSHPEKFNQRNDSKNENQIKKNNITRKPFF